MENFYFAIGYTTITMIVAFAYFNYGKKQGIEEACMVFREKEPEAFKRMRSTLKEEIGVGAE